ncbi:MAG TPA: hypothetical protein VGF76_27130, partial [Polyangiaceae bacterium]
MPRVVKSLRLVASAICADTPASRAPTLDDTQLLAALRARDSGAAAALHDRAWDIVERTVQKHLRCYDNDKEDLCQLAFIE